MIDLNMLLYAYSNGYFPMADEDQNQEIHWFKPELRGIIPLNTFHIPKNLKRLYKQNKFELRMNSAFEEVIRGCSKRDKTWISEEIIEAYINLFNSGYAFSFETWHNSKLVGGLYGVSIGKAFFGESMFHTETDASKIALIYLVDYLKKNDFILLDTQFLNPHLKQFGAIEIPDAEYMNLLYDAI